VVVNGVKPITTETQRTQRLHRENKSRHYTFLEHLAPDDDTVLEWQCQHKN
jgi:hypothetical protein